MATVTIPNKSKLRRKQVRKGRQFRVTDWTYEYLRMLKTRSGLPMSEALELVLRQVNVKEARP